MIVAGLDRISTLVTDEDARPEELEVFKAAGINVILAKVANDNALQHLA
jgi:hypothetical protein